MSGHRDRAKARRYAREAHRSLSICPNCKGRGSHFVPPSISGGGFFICEPALVPSAPTLCSICRRVHGLEEIHECE
jgi:hypothetical protein